MSAKTLQEKLKDFAYFFIVNLLPRRKGIPVLMYHSVIGGYNLRNALEPKIFNRQMDYLKKRNYQVISLTRLLDFLKQKKELPRKALVLTFDDGFYDNYLNVWPVLKKYNFPATIFISAGLVGKYMKLEDTSLRLLSWQQIKRMHQSGIVDFQPHSFNHYRLDKLSSSQEEEEIEKSRSIIEQKLNKKCFFFAYPFGKYNINTIKILRKKGFKAGLTIKTGLVGKKDNLFELKRISINSLISFVRFKAKLSGWIFIRK